MIAPDRPEAQIDFTRRFIPEEYTPLFHTSAYRDLHEPVRLRYNQLHAIYFNEQVAFFEQEMLSPMLRSLRGRDMAVGLAAKLESVILDERRHTDMFLALNRRCAPEFYTTGNYRFIRIHPWLLSLVHGMSWNPRLFPLLAWLTLLQEERALYYSKGILEGKDRLEPHFVEVHRIHLADETGHVRTDEELLDWLWPRTGKVVRQLNARLLRWMIGEFFLLPKRSGLQVVKQLSVEFPSLDLGKLHDGINGLGADTGYLCTLYSREMTPRSFARFDRHPEFRSLSRILPGYRSSAHAG